MAVKLSLPVKNEDATSEDISDLLREIANDIQPNRGGDNARKKSMQDDFYIEGLEIP